MSRRFITLLERVTRIREWIDREQRSSAPSPVRLIRMQQLYLRLSENLRGLTRQRLTRMASAPRFRSEGSFYTANPARTLSGYW